MAVLVGVSLFVKFVWMVDAVRRNPETARATDNEVENEMKNWLKFAKDRDGGRRLRYIRAQNTAL